MNILICGAGEVGRHTAESLGQEGHGITIIDKNAAKLYALEDVMDARTLVGDATNASVMREAGCESADVVISATQNDQTNLLTASLAAGLGAGRTIARVHHGAFFDGGDFDYRNHFGIDDMVCPEYSTAMAIARKLRSPGALAVERFADGKVEMQRIPVSDEARVLGKPLMEAKLPDQLRVALVERDGESNLAQGNTVIQKGDVLTLVGTEEALDKGRKLFQAESYRRKRVMIMGGSPLAVWLCRALQSRSFSVRLFETDTERAEELSSKLDWVTILKIDPLDPDTLTLERVDQADAFVATTDSDEQNILAAARAKAMGAGSVVAVLQRGIYIPFTEYVGINHAFSPRESAVSEIKQMLHDGPIREMGALAEGLTSVYQVRVPKDGNGKDGGVVGKPLSQVSFSNQIMVAAIQRIKEVYVPGGNDAIQPGDTLLIVGGQGIEKSLAKDFGIKSSQLKN